MSTVTKSHTFVAGTLIEASEANQNFDDLVTFINNDVITKDAAKAFTVIPSGPAVNPTTINQFTRKKYVDDSISTLSTTLTDDIDEVADDLTALTTTVTNNKNSSDTALALRLQALYMNAGQTTATAITGNPKILVGVRQVSFNSVGAATINFTGFTTVYSASVGVGQGTNGPMSVVLTSTGNNSLGVTAYDQVVTQGLDNVWRNTKFANAQGWVSFVIIGK